MAEQTAASAVAPFNFKQAIAQMIQRSGSDLLLKVGRAPTVRVNGELTALRQPQPAGRGSLDVRPVPGRRQPGGPGACGA